MMNEFMNLNDDFQFSTPSPKFSIQICLFIYCNIYLFFFLLFKYN